MSRTIKFRVWDKENKNFYEPTYEGYKGKIEEVLISPELGHLHIRTIDKFIHQSLFPGRFELMQFTGLYDKNHTEIYEGDIVKDGQLICTGNYTIDNSDSTIVHFESGLFKAGQISLCSINSQTKVIGNIYENSDLLKGWKND